MYTSAARTWRLHHAHVHPDGQQSIQDLPCTRPRAGLHRIQYKALLQQGGQGWAEVIRPKHSKGVHD
jgi:hypothetical protein